MDTLQEQDHARATRQVRTPVYCAYGHPGRLSIQFESRATPSVSGSDEPMRVMPWAFAPVHALDQDGTRGVTR